MRVYRVVVVVAIGALALLTGCQTSPVLPDDDGAIPSGYTQARSGEVQRLLIKYARENPTAPPAWKRPLSITHPGWWPFQKKRVYVVRHKRVVVHREEPIAMGDALFHNIQVYQNGKYVAYASATSDALSPVLPGQYPPDAPMPDVILVQGWLHTLGQNPCVGTRATVVQATGCKLVIYFLPGNKQRVCFEEAEPGENVHLYYSDNDVPPLEMTPGSYVEYQTKTSAESFGAWERWNTNAAGEILRPLVELDTDAAHQSVLQAIADDRNNNDPY